MIIINIACLAAVWLMVEQLKREREERRQEKQKFNEAAKKTRAEYKRLHNAFKGNKKHFFNLVEDNAQRELKHLNGRVTTPEEAKRKQMLNNVITYMKELQ